MKTMKLLLCVAWTIIAIALTSCAQTESKKVVIYSSADELRNTFFMEDLQKKFPDYDIQLMYLATGNNGAKLKAEGANTDADIVLGLEVSYLNQIRDNLADLSGYDTSVFVDDVIDPNLKYLPWERYSGVIAINKEVLARKGLETPKDYEDLLNPKLKGLISMPNPRSSSTGHLFLKYLVDKVGENKAYAYFDMLAQNVNAFPSSGSGVTTALVKGDVAIGFTMTFSAVNQNDLGANLSMVYFDNAAPSSLSGIAMLSKSEKRKAVREVFQYLAYDLSRRDKTLYSPEVIFKGQIITKQNYPTEIPYVSIILDSEEKQRLLDKWKY